MEEREVYEKISRYCAYRERCTMEVLEKLADLGVSSTLAAEVLQWLNDERFVDDGRFAAAFARGKWKIKHWGRNKIRHELRKKDIPESLIEEGLQEIAEEPYRQKLTELLEKYQRQKKEEPPHIVRQKTIRYFLSRGYEWELIREALSG